MTDFQTLVNIEDSGHLNPEQKTELAAYRANMPGSSSTGSYDEVLSSLPSAVDFAKGLNASENDVFGDYLKVAQGQPQPLDLYNQLEEGAGIPQLKTAQSTIQGQIYDLEDTLRRVEPDVAARSRNSIVTEAQRRGMVTAARDPLIEDLGWLGQSLGRVSNAISNEKADIGTKVSLAMQGFQQQLEPYKMQLSMKVDQNSRLMTGFTADRQTKLDVLLQKIHRNEQISDMERNEAFELAKMERQFENQKNLLLDEYNQPNNNVINANGRQLLVNMNDGSIVADLGSSKAAGGDGAGIPTPTGAGGQPTSNPPTSKPTSIPPLSTSYNKDYYNYIFGGTQ